MDLCVAVIALCMGFKISKAQNCYLLHVIFSIICIFVLSQKIKGPLHLHCFLGL